MLRRRPLLLVLLVATLVSGAAFAQSAVRSREGLLVQAHRGFSTLYPENTLAAIRAAFDAGADRVEVDLALTADDRVVLMHDRTVDRTTDGSGRVASFTLEELRRLDAGAWKGARFAGERVPTLEEALEAADGRGELNLELKANGRTLLDILDLVETSLAVVEAEGALGRVVFSSFDVRALRMVEERAPEARLLVVDWSEGGTGSGLDVALARGWYGVALRARYLSEARLRRAAEGGLFVHVGTGPTERIDRWIAWGLGGVSNDDPALLTSWLRGGE